MRKSLCTLFSVALLSLGGLSAVRAQEPIRVAQLSDVHDGGAHYSEVDTDIGVTDALRENPQALVLTGDSNDNSHDQRQFYDRLHLDLPRLIDRLKSFQGPLFIALGNDDFQTNYQTPPEVLHKTFVEFQKDFGSRYYLDELGDGESPSRLGGVLWLSLNTVVFHPANRAPEAPAQAAKVLDFLQSELNREAAARTPVAVLMHIPPTVDYFNNKLSWKQAYIDRMLAIVRAYPGQMIFLTGHYHRNQVYRVARRQGDIPVLSGGALASKYGYAPNWRSYALHMDQSGKRFQEVDYTIHYPRHPDWTSAYQVVPANLRGWLNSALSDGEQRLRYFQDMFGHHDQAVRLYRERDEKQRMKDQFNVE